jgi:hypothetical protein
VAVIWQDLVFALANAAFSIALIPTIRATEKPAISTSVWIGLTLLVVAYTQATLGLYLGGGVTVIEAGLWGVLAWQAWRKR